jgi:transposase-like protein
MTMEIKKVPDDIKFTEGVAEDFYSDDVHISDKVPALYEQMVCKRGGRTLSPNFKLTPVRYETIIRYIQAGAYISHAANAVGINEETLKKWIRLGLNDSESIYGAFVDDLKRAKSAAVMRNVMIVQRAAQDDWQAAKWLLSVMEPDIYGAKSTVRTEIVASEPENNTVIMISNEELAKLADIQNRIEEQNRVVDADFKVMDDDEEEVQDVCEEQ